ncbi:nucleotidyl transferase AbiEii/AbiGii toxin family protein [Mariniflexile sp. HMF6888]|uniref:nucleotidyl transferase AbiEii/AbiGii toxin family protein n=1 Tax=Mariniflexile sp. HMF6888 TaxID=3373086 RepID=UPI0037BA085D
MKLHEDIKIFEDAIRITAQQLNIAEIHIEKDYWVTLALHTIFNNPIGKQTVFKGGTALSKCFGFIERFSEDIDLVVLNNEGESGNQLRNKLKKITKVVATKIEEVDVEGITNKLGMIRKIAYNYPKLFQGEFGQVRNVIVVEATWLGRFEPYRKQHISSYVFEMMQMNNQLDIAETYDMLPFEVQVLDVKRTICEKIMSLVRFSYGDDVIYDLRNKIRHTYDIHQLLKQDTIKAFFNSPEFDSMLLTVGNDDVFSFKSGNKWLENHPKDALLFTNTEDVWNELKGTYNNEFKDLVYGQLPKDIDVLKTLLEVKQRLQNIKWNVKV